MSFPPVPGSGPPSGAAGGDLGGNYPAPHVVGIQTKPVSNTAPTTGQVLVYNGTTWVPSTGPAPGGTAGGDLSGTYPNPAVAKLQGTGISTDTPTADMVMAFDGTEWEPTSVYNPKPYWPRSATTIETLQLISSGGNADFHAVITCNFFIVEKPQPLNTVFLAIQAQAGNVCVGIYSADGVGFLPNTRLATSGSVACPASGVSQPVTLTTTPVLAPGLYWSAIVSDNATAHSYYYNLASDGILLPFAHARADATFAFPLPATLSGATFSAGAIYAFSPAYV